MVIIPHFVQPAPPRQVSTANILRLRKLREDNKRRRAALRPQQPIIFRIACSIRFLFSLGSGSAPVVGEMDFDGRRGILWGGGKVNLTEIQDLVYRRIGDRWREQEFTEPTRFSQEAVTDEINIAGRFMLQFLLDNNITFRLGTITLTYAAGDQEKVLSDESVWDPTTGVGGYPYMAILKAERTDVSPILTLRFPAGGDYRRVAHGQTDPRRPDLYLKGDNILGLVVAATVGMTIKLYVLPEWFDLVHDANSPPTSVQVPPRFHHMLGLYAAEALFGADNTPEKARTLREIAKWEEFIQNTNEPVIDLSSHQIQYEGVAAGYY